MSEVWRVEIGFNNGASNCICCTESGGKTAYDGWYDSRSGEFLSAERSAEKPIEIEGFTDTADKAYRKLAFIPSEVNSISVFRVY